MSSSLNESVLKELEALKFVGIPIADAVFDLARGDLSEYDNMNISDLADLLIMLNKGGADG